MRPEVALQVLADDAALEPLAQLARAPGARPRHVGLINLRFLSPYQRVLLACDGPVNRLIEAYTLDRLEVRRIAQDEERLAEADDWLELPAGAMVIRREIVIQRHDGGALYAHARSVLALERLPGRVVRRLDRDGEGLGEILNQEGLECRSELLWFGRERHAPPPEALRGRGITRTLTRAYRLLSGGRPIAVVTERFPLRAGPAAAHW